MFVLLWCVSVCGFSRNRAGNVNVVRDGRIMPVLRYGIHVSAAPAKCQPAQTTGDEEAESWYRAGMALLYSISIPYPAVQKRACHACQM